VDRVLFVNQCGKLLGGTEVGCGFFSVEGNCSSFIIVHHLSES